MPRPAERLWTPSAERIEQAGITRFRRWLAANRGLQFQDYEALWRWSTDELEAFWGALWEFSGILSHSPWERVLDRRVMPGARWFEGATLNYAEHVLARARRADAGAAPAIVFQSETRPRTEIAWATLAGQVGALAATLRRLGVERGDRVVSCLPNIPETVAALLATASLGAIWSGCSPDMGEVGVLDRFRQIAPRVLFAVDGYSYNGEPHDRRETVRALLAGLPSLEAVVFVPNLDPGASLAAPAGSAAQILSFAEATGRAAPLGFTAVPFAHPLWIVYSSGTTGMPKPIVHSHGGIVLEGKKSSALHLDYGERDRLFWYSSTSWIMWNSWVSSLASGCTALQYDGSPSYPDLGALWRLAERERATFFGVSAAFISLCAKARRRPRATLDLSSLRTVASTGSPLPASGYRWVYEQVHPDVMLASISGGTDPGAAFLTACPILPVHAGEMQCRALGVAVHAFNDAGKPVLDEVGELAVTAPMPSMPVELWGDEGGRRYFESYFDTWPGVWRHGDWLELIPRPESVTSIIHGRADSTINRHGIRMGTSELYRVVEQFPEVADSLVVDLEYLGRDSYLALFVVLREPGEAVGGAAAGSAARSGATAPFATGVELALRDRILAAIRSDLSPRYAPDGVFAIASVPRTLSGKKLEVPVRKILLGQPVEKSVNRDSMGNQGSIDWFVDFARGRGTG